jgi:outer membrane lipoprotein-sorting protein
VGKRLLGAFAGALIAGSLIAPSAVAQKLPPPPPASQPSANTPSKPAPKPKAVKRKPRQQAPLSLTGPPPHNTPASNAPLRPPADVGSAPSSAPPAAPSSAPLIVQPSPPRPGQPALNTRQLMLVERISNYLSNLRTLVGEFKQIAPDGTQSAGDFYLLKPGKVRFDYNPPSPTELIADGRSVAVRDRNLASQDLFAISQTPLRFLLADRIDLLRDTKIVAVYGDNVFITVVIEERQIARGTYRLMIMFDARTTELRQWVVTDPQGLDTTVAVYNLDTRTAPDPDLFKIDYTRYVR